MKSNETLLLCVQVTLFNPAQPHERINTFAFLDSGCSSTFITNYIARTLHLQIENEQEISLQTFAAAGAQTHSSSNVKGGLILENYETKILNAKTLEFLTEKIEMKLMNPYGRDDHHTWTTEEPPGIIIGNDYFWELVLSNNFYMKTLPNGYNLIHTRLGNIMSGKPLQNHQSFMALSDIRTLENPLQHQKLEELVEKFWSLESAGISDDVSRSDDDKCLQEFNDTIYFDFEGRYMVRLPFKEDISELSNNFDLAISRLRSTVATLSKQPGLLERHHNIIVEQLERGIIEEVDDNDNTRPCHYLPHHGVISETSKNTKLRCVYDGSAKTKGRRSLNEVFYRGPVLLPEMAGILLRIRFMEILLIGDIEEAYLMVGLDEDSRNFTRFLWLRDPSLGMQEGNIVTYVFKRVTLGLITSPFLLAGTIHYHLCNYNTPLAQKILRNIYVDNLFLEATNIDDEEIFRQAGMNVREFTSNDSSFNKFLEKAERTPVDKTMKILGLQWDTEADSLILSLPKSTELNTTWTKRKVLKHVASIYDPLGWVSPSTLIAKALVQKLWKTQLPWDAVLP
ncbi:hypothetical protein NECAME_01296 [Necator americanus]|uniref:DUF1758 domain-containing protein n=1 Tax=Necator americanus TaxID=51031 RepID=W2U1D3_NECAM|nr:hypothetical protein NECAME_01296 [Necator americanus]ETN87137.1 hypothetical protein NECAME_01296 [Necator americanus]